MDNKIWLSLAHMGGKEEEYIKQAFDTNWVVPLGPNVDGFEKDLENFLGDNKNVVALSSGTSALHLSLVQLGVSFGDEVICQSFTFAASANPIAYQGAKPVFVDSEKDTWNMSPEFLRIAIEDRLAKTGKLPKAIIPVHLYGMPAKIDEIMEIAKEYNIPVVEDAAEALGSKYEGKQCGTFGEFAALSFNGNKIITTSGGGALVCSTKEEADRTKFFATQARDNAPHYQHTHIGYNYRMSNICAGIGRGQMHVLTDHIELRRANNKFYQDLFSDIDGVTVFVEPNNDYYSNYWLTCITVDEKVAGKNREELRLALLNDNIESRPLWKPMHLQPVFENCPYYGEKVSEHLFDNGLCLPSGSSLTEADRNRIAKSIKSFFDK